tara:strand:+ start:6169 stop:7413 length:1245 start_codon:yes stop_codon:yes gene_type:complete
MTTNREAFEMWGKFSDAQDSKQNENSFKVQVIDTPIPVSGPATTTDDPETLNKAGIDSKWQFMGRLIDKNMPHEKFLENVCDSSVSDKTNGLACLHSIVTVSKAGAMPAFGPGDIVEISCDAAAGDIAQYDLQGVDFERVIEVFREPSKTGRDVTCAGLPAVANGKIAANFGEIGSIMGTTTVGAATGTGPGQKAVYIGGGNNIPVTNGKMSDAGLITGATQGYKSGHPRVLTDIAPEWDAMAAAFAAHFSDKGWKLAGSGDRTYQTQVKLRAEWCAKGSCGKASKPGYSNHGWGLAVDTHYYDSNGKKKSLSFTGEAYKWLFDNAATYNWEHPYWAQKPSVSEKLGRPCVAPPNKKCGSNIEVWHWESTRLSSLLRKGDAAYKEAVAAAQASQPQDPPPEAGDGATEPTAETT